MKNKIYVGIGIAATIVLVSIVLMPKSPEPEVIRPSSLDFTYSLMNSNLKEDLSTFSISMSSPVIIKNKNSIDEYCNFFDDKTKQDLIQYCTSTELKDKNGKFLGNIHMVGSADSPKLVIVIIQSDPFLNQITDIKTVFDLTIDSTICDCWEDYSPDRFSSVSDWIDGLKEFHTSGVKPHSKSKVLELDGKTLQIELTTNQDGYLWKLLISS